MAFASADDVVELGEDWLDDPEWAELEDWLVHDVISDFLADTDAGDYF